MRVLIAHERTGYRLDAKGERVPVIVPAKTIGEAGPIGFGQFADTRNVVLSIDGRDVIVPNVRPGQYVRIVD